MRKGQPVYATARQGLRTRIAGPLAERFRARRFELYLRAMAPLPEDEIVDVGCGAGGLASFAPDARVTGVDRLEQPGYARDGRRFVQADARRLPFADDEFDIAYSNSLIEHLDPPDREAFARELRRVARRYFVQTPNRWFPLEPHSLLPLVQFLPTRLRRRVWRLGVAGGEYEEIELLGRRELQGLFPDAVILAERVGPLVKSLVAAGPAERVATRPRASG